MPNNPRIAIFYTGGTISMTKSDEEGGTVPTLSGEDIRESVPELDDVFDVEHYDYSRHPGPHMTIERILTLYDAINDALTEGFDGVVVAHGTDTIEESAYICDLVHDDP
ncbi:MAG: asparaginase, partial [Planctomycetes bacterium]|nr:asparaginase [Planctomycetota bacterium]